MEVKLFLSGCQRWSHVQQLPRRPIFSLGATVFLCLDDGSGLLFDSGRELEVFLKAQGRETLFVYTTLFFSFDAAGSFDEICPEC